MSATLRSHQERLLGQIDAALASGVTRLVAQAPTGFGKTIVAAHRLRRLQDAGKRGTLIVPALSLVDQSVEKLFAEGVRDVGVIQANHVLTNYARPIQVASVQTLERREMPPADEILIDEVHRWFKFYPRLLAASTAPVIGLTATPWTKGTKFRDDRGEVKRARKKKQNPGPETGATARRNWPGNRGHIGRPPWPGNRGHI
jgi:DNA repair protein RadD